MVLVDFCFDKDVWNFLFYYDQQLEVFGQLCFYMYI
jgi:hypothetical protein